METTGIRTQEGLGSQRKPSQAIFCLTTYLSTHPPTASFHPFTYPFIHPPIHQSSLQEKREDQAQNQWEAKVQTSGWKEAQKPAEASLHRLQK